MNKAQRLQILARESLQQYREPITAAALAGGLYLVLTQWNLEIESLLVMAFLFLRTIGKIASLQTNFQAIASSLPSFWFVRSVLSTAAVAAEKDIHGKQPALTSSIRFDHVSFSYTKQKQILHEMCIEFPKGHFIALVGASGSGKTTIGDLAIGLLRPTSGEVFIDDVPLSEIDQGAWRSMIGYVPQDTPLLHDTVLSNITLRDSGITEEAARTALIKADAWSFISALPDGIHTIVGERGTRLSGGQRQRIAIARALANRPSLLILDEATAALDPVTEAEICRTLETLVGELTIVAISHQDALQDAADIVYRIEGGTATRIKTKHPPNSHLKESS
jgi:ATP-binding cassette subfamily C protein